MFLPYWIVLAVPLLVFPSVSHRHHSLLFEREKNGLAADNAAIQLGSGDAAWATSLEENNQLLDVWEKRHHPWHACRYVPLTAAECTPVDVAWEAAIRLRHAQAGAAAQLAWQTATARGQAEIVRLQATEVTVRRAPVAPIRPRFCPLCHLPTGWQIVATLTSQLVNANAQGTVTVSTQKKGGERGYDYDIH